MIFRNIIVLIILLKVVKSDEELYLGSSCKMHDGSDGICKKAHSCDFIKNQLAKKIITHQQIKRCAFERFDLIICCTDTPEPSGVSTLPVTKSQIACDMIKSVTSQFSDLNPHVTNGLPVQLGEYPHMAALGPYDSVADETKYDCGGSLISSTYVLTAAHCVSKKGERRVKLGKLSLDTDVDDEQNIEIKVKRAILHPNYTARKSYNDIALLELEKPVPKYSKVLYPACLHTGANEVNPTDKLVAIGWGIFNVNIRKMSKVLLKGELSYVPQNECNQKYEKLIDSKLDEGIKDDQICAFDFKNPEGKRVDACQGDSGGPLNLRVGDIEYVLGITSVGLNCATEAPGIYTRVASYLHWIEDIVWPGEVTV